MRFVWQGKTSGYIGRLVDFGLASAMWHLLVPAVFAIGSTEAMEFLFGVRVLAGFIAGESLFAAAVLHAAELSVPRIIITQLSTLAGAVVSPYRAPPLSLPCSSRPHR
jgi:hypothetical protein